jgi:hypothetical protein
MSTSSTSALKVEHHGEATNDFDVPTENGAQKSNLNQQLEQTASYKNAAKPFVSSASEMRFVQGLIACLSSGLDDLSEDVSLRLQSARVAAVLRRRR